MAKFIVRPNGRRRRLGSLASFGLKTQPSVARIRARGLIWAAHKPLTSSNTVRISGSAPGGTPARSRPLENAFEGVGEPIGSRLRGGRVRKMLDHDEAV